MLAPWVDKLYRTIGNELAHHRFVIISLVQYYDPRFWNVFHMYVIVDRTTNGDYVASSNAYEATIQIRDFKERMQEIQGTEILTCTEAT